MVATGGALEEERAQAERELDFFDLKGALEAAVDWMNLSPLVIRNSLRAAICARGKLHGSSWPMATEIGTIGRLAENVAASYKFRQPVYVLELDLSALAEWSDESRFSTHRCRVIRRWCAISRCWSIAMLRSKRSCSAVSEQQCG